MPKNRRQATQAGSRAAATQPDGLNHGTPSLVAMDSPDDPQTGALAGQTGQNRAKTSGRDGRR